MRGGRDRKGKNIRNTVGNWKMVKEAGEKDYLTKGGRGERAIKFEKNREKDSGRGAHEREPRKKKKVENTNKGKGASTKSRGSVVVGG